MDPTQAQYSDQVQQVAHNLNQSVGGGLPVTGLDVVILCIIALAMIGGGIALRHLNPHREDA